MSVAEQPLADVDPIMVEVFRTRLEAIGQEAGAAIENTAISPVVTETKDYSVTIFDGAGSLIHGTSKIAGHFGASMNAVAATLARHGDGIAEGDVFIANDPHSGGGFHPQDVIVQRPVFYRGKRVAWVTNSAHMLDMGGMVPGSTATQATECYQEALRFPPVRIFRAGEEVEDIWALFATNIRSFDTIEMDLRSLVAGGHVAGQKLVDLIDEIDLDCFETWSAMLDASTGREFRRRLAALEPGTYACTAWAEVGDQLYKIPCTLRAEAGSLCFDLTEAPPQIPHFVNSKPYILRASLVPTLRSILADDLPLTQSVYDAIEIRTRPGSLMDCRPPAPIGAAHMDCCIAIHSSAIHCVQLALAATAGSKTPLTAQHFDAQATNRWSYPDQAGHTRLFTMLDGVAGGSPAAFDRDGLDMCRDRAGQASIIMLADVEVLESVYPLRFRGRSVALGADGAGRHRAGGGCLSVIEPSGEAVLSGNMAGTRGWCPTPGLAGGRPGARTSFRVVRADGEVEELGMQATGVVLHEGDRFELTAGSGGGFGDPLTREPAAVARDVAGGRIGAAEAEDVYGVVLTGDGEPDAAATRARRQALGRQRLDRAAPPARPAPATDAAAARSDVHALFPGIVQRGRLAVAESSGAPLATAPAHWTEGCPVLEEPYPTAGPRQLLLRSYLDPSTGHALHTELVPEGEPRSFAALPDRWARA